VISTLSMHIFVTINNHKRPGVPPMNRFYVTREEPIRPVRAYYAPGIDAPEFLYDYYTFEYKVDPNMLVPPKNCS
jgi:hypothetical protein